MQEEMLIGSQVRIFDKDGLLYTEGILQGVSRRKQTRLTQILTFTVFCPLSPARASGAKVLVEYQKDGQSCELMMILGGHHKVEGGIESELHACETLGESTQQGMPWHSL